MGQRIFVIVLAILLVPVLSCSGAGSGAQAPERRAGAPWTEALGRPADFVASVDLAGIRRDPLYGPLLAAASTNANARYAPLATADRIDVAGNFDGASKGTVIAIFRGVQADASVREDNELFRVAPGAWVLASPSSSRVRSSMTRSGYVLPDALSSDSGVLFDITARPNEATRARAFGGEEREIADSLEWVSLAVTTSSRREVIVRARFSSSRAASDAEIWMRGRLMAYVKKNELYAELLRKILSLDIDTSGTDLVVRIRFSEELIAYAIHRLDRSRDRWGVARPPEPAPEPPRAAPAPYASQCPPGRRFDAERGCVDAR